MTPTLEQAKEFLHKICRGTTCCKFYEVIDIVEDYIIAYHKSHFSHYNRMGGYSVSCNAARRVYKFNPNFEKVRGHDCIYPLFEVNGRYTNEKKKQVYDFIKGELEK